MIKLKLQICTSNRVGGLQKSQTWLLEGFERVDFLINLIKSIKF